MSFKNKLSTLVAISLATTVVSGFAIPKDDEDSVRSWGPWATLVKPAAGPQTPAPTTLAGPVVPGFGSGDATSFTPTVITPTAPEEVVAQGRCTAGIACGYAFITQDARESQGEDLKVPIVEGQLAASSRTSPQAATPVLNPIPTFAQVAPAPGPGPGFPSMGALIAQNVITNLTVNSITDIPLSEAALNQSVFFMGSQFWFGFGQGVFLRGTTVDVAGTPFAYGSSSRKDEGFSKSTSFIYGESTGTADLNALNAGNVQANYTGAMISGRTPVSIAVDFGAATWSGSWNGGADSGFIRTSLSSDNVNVTSGQVGFNASGTISGANIVSTSILATDASAISGTVNGSFFGGQAGVLAGAVDVTKTTEAYTDGTHRDLFVTATGDVQLPLSRDN